MDAATRLSDFLGESDLGDRIEGFLERHGDEFLAGRAEDGEMALACHDIYGSFLELIESSLAGFLEAEELSAEEFRDLLAASAAAEDRSSRFVQALLRSWEFESFAELVTEYCAEYNPSDSSSDCDGESESSGGESGGESGDDEGKR